MANHSINITNGSGTKSLVDGTYAVTGNFPGYDNTTLLPISVNVTAEVTEYSFTIAGTGTVTLNVTDGLGVPTPIEGATFYRCDSAGNTYGNAVVTDASGIAVFENIPYQTDSGILFYYKQTVSDEEHTFDEELKSVSIKTQTQTIDVINPPATLRTFIVTDANYDGLPIEAGTLELS